MRATSMAASWTGSSMAVEEVVAKVAAAMAEWSTAWTVSIPSCPERRRSFATILKSHQESAQLQT